RLVPLDGAVPGGPGGPGDGGADDSIAARFQLGDRLGGGRTGEVRRAADSSTGQRVALKVIAPAVVALPGLAPRLERELKQLERVHSAGVAKVVASGKRGDEPWIALELLADAQTLAEAIAARGPIPIDQAAHLIEVIGEALIEAAQVGVVHRDLAPKNILFAGDEIKLINFSLPVPPAGGADGADKVAGVAEFVAPEQHDGKPVDQRSNLYSLGALYYYVLTGQTVQHDDAGAIKPPSGLASVPGGVEAIILRALDRSPTKRFLTVRQFVDEVGRVARGETDPKAAAAPAGRAKPRAELVQTLLGIRASTLVPNAPVLPGAAGASPGAAVSAPIVSSAASTAAGMVVNGPSAALVAANEPGGHAPSVIVSASPEPSAPQAAPAPSTPQAAPAPSTPQAAPAPSAGLAPGLAPDRSPWAPPVAEPGVTGMPALAMPAIEPATSKISTLPDSAPLPPVTAASPAVAGMPALAVPPDTSAAPAASATGSLPAAPVVPAPLLAAPLLAHGKKSDKGDKPEKSDKGKFRETMWFKKGELDAEAAQAAAAERARTGKDGADQTDQLPIDERYKDDGSLSRSDKEKYSLRTGATMSTKALRESGSSKIAGKGSDKISEDELINEMRGGRNKLLAVVAVGVVVLVLLIVLIAH
ncbi:MAG TPA: protein kinase, partial [Kofleriaceae bacterium]|nr:protein kinase [Kofleriaceae bacterium]